MSNLAYNKGRAFEYLIMREIEKDGYLTFRQAGSKSPFDIIAMLIKDGKELPLILAIQCKYGSSPYKKDLIKLSQLNLPHIVQKQLWIKKPYQEIRKIIVP